MRKFIAFVFLLCFCCLLASAGVIRRLVWTVETSDPVPRNWAITYGETFDMEVCYFDHKKAMDLAGSAVVLHCRTNGMAEGYSFQSTGSVMRTAGWATVRVAVDSLLPAGLTSAAYTLAVTAGGSTNLITAKGTFSLSGTGTGLFGAPLPAPVAAQLAARIDAAEVAAESNRLAIAAAEAHALRQDNPHKVNATQVGAATPYQLQQATGAVAQASADALRAYAATSAVSRLYGSNRTEWIDGDGGKWSVVANTNYWVTFSENFMSYTEADRPPFFESGSVFPFSSTNGWFCDFDGMTCTIIGPHTAIWQGYGFEDGYCLLQSFTGPSGGSAYVFPPSVSTNKVDAVALKSDLAAISFPTNYAAGIILWDAGSNRWSTLLISNDLITVWEVIR